MKLDLTPFKHLVKLRCGLTLEGLGEEKLAAAIRERQAATGTAAPALYFTLISTDEAEFQELVTLLTINETYFFREREQIDLLVDRLLPRLLADSDRRLPVRILSAGCSTGEEPYSLAMAILDRFGDSAPALVSIMAGDIDLYALAKARAARYGQFSFRGVDPAVRARYFRTDGGVFELDQRVRRMVQFHHLNLLAESFPPGLADIDVAFFRNVSIYFDERTRRAIQHNLHAAMSERGILIIGSAETLANDLGVFRMIAEDGAFYFTKAPALLPPRVAPPLPVFPPRFAEPMPAPVSAPAPAQEQPPSLEALRALIRDKKIPEALAGLAIAKNARPKDVALLVLEGYAHLMDRAFDAAEAAARLALEQDDWCIEAMVILGLAAKWQGRSDDAIRWFKQAVYGRHNCWPAHWYLADLQRASGAADTARRAFRVVLQQTAAQPDPDGGLVLPLGLPVAEVRFLCERHSGRS